MSMELLRKYLWLWVILGSISVSAVIAIVFVCINRWLSNKKQKCRHRITQLQRNKSDSTIKRNKYQVETPPYLLGHSFSQQRPKAMKIWLTNTTMRRPRLCARWPCPKYQVAMPKYQESTPKCQESMPKYQESMPKYQESMPKCQESMPKYQVTMPKYQESMPKCQESMPKYQESMPKYQEAMSDYEEASPDYEEASPDYEEASPDYEEASPDYENPTPELFDYVKVEAEVKILPPPYRKTDEETDDASTEDYDDIDGEDDGEEDYDDLG
ncbi:DNA-directed RNA polymerase II subunit RPB1 [Dissostichus eleginoides]|uniref:DNA-directed RNA polymerase II subunit RPB1 n=1 Tax=Dissostichus eleginoides TaxID=100907 RepID=A0AAD9BG95_DISEL|nr:DNA-directed RNA polymerase II subunit RPB1 [Dissostichus eleginoides]